MIPQKIKNVDELIKLLNKVKNHNLPVCLKQEENVFKFPITVSIVVIKDPFDENKKTLTLLIE